MVTKGEAHHSTQTMAPNCSIEWMLISLHSVCPQVGHSQHRSLADTPTKSTKIANGLNRRRMLCSWSPIPKFNHFNVFLLTVCEFMQTGDKQIHFCLYTWCSRMFLSQNRDSGLPRVWYTVTYDYVTVPSVLISIANDLKDFSSKSLIFSNNS